MTTVSIRLDDAEKLALDEMLSEMGMTLSTFYSVYTKRALRDRKIPFDIEALSDPFYSKSNLCRLRHSADQITQGKTVTKTIDELEAMESE
ncbi:type II toxin-antitoxin system RelB/DinJ family antitoxin [Aminicella lysinilytica]|jgi:DNA-damage-inducible protein J|uniref:DNA-damage-inducible protein J n=1 Tax=Aminicella lysinilytica TaxID=433323 RepID=A0A4R6PY41_9FIRM|nr:type II toxin-antitoxin system RelB/DinJ family antitoxin [Aminicella lysinilytica]TDP51490.1 DNA-damage-inducible protein J [Aminicella lysinilytica]